MEKYTYFTIGLIFVGISSYIFFRKKKKDGKMNEKLTF